MKEKPLLKTGSDSKNIFGTSIKSNYWKQRDFILACTAALVFGLSFHLLSLEQYFPISKPVVTPLFIVTFFVLPILEETVFRGLIQESIHKLIEDNKHRFVRIRTILIAKISMANFVTSILFCLSHLWFQPLHWALAVFIPSILFGYFKDQYNALTPAILLHIFYNMVFYLM